MLLYFSHHQSQSSTKAKASTERFLKNSLRHHSRYDLSDMLCHKAVVLNYTRPKKDKLKEHKKVKGLNARQKRAMKIFQIKQKHQRLVDIKDRSAVCLQIPWYEIPLSPSFQLRGLPSFARTLETVYHWPLWWIETDKVGLLTTAYCWQSELILGCCLGQRFPGPCLPFHILSGLTHPQFSTPSKKQIINYVRV